MRRKMCAIAVIAMPLSNRVSTCGKIDGAYNNVRVAFTKNGYVQCTPNNEYLAHANIDPKPKRNTKTE